MPGLPCCRCGPPCREFDKVWERSCSSRLTLLEPRLAPASRGLHTESDPPLLPRAVAHRRAVDVEEELQGLARAQGRNANALVDLAKENAEIVAEMKVGAWRARPTEGQKSIVLPPPLARDDR